ncbi:hypothetical protein AB4160_13070 [Shewanella sp. 10N.286.51.B8]|uniref:hypothetical protein n=1 Tax=Shewanella sp. 10N.286.51.B8 TaxID=3229708 RepID=UPI00354D33C2
MRFFCGITIYHPSDSDIVYISELSRVFEQVIVFDNTEGCISNLNKTILDDSNVLILSNGKNDGLSFAFNEICFYFYNGLDEVRNSYVCIFDQDSRIPQLSIKNLMSVISRQKHNDVAIYAPRVAYGDSIIDCKPEVTEAEWVISSGSFLNLELFKDIGPFDENYFIDRLDYDYCYEARKQGFKVKVIESTVLRQKLGEPKALFGIEYSEHNSIRNYYMARNRVYFYLKNKEHFSFLYLRIAISSLKQLVKVIIFDSEKMKKVQYILKGSWDGMNARMGKLITEVV